MHGYIFHAVAILFLYSVSVCGQNTGTIIVAPTEDLITLRYGQALAFKCENDDGKEIEFLLNDTVIVHGGKYTIRLWRERVNRRTVYMLTLDSRDAVKEDAGIYTCRTKDQVEDPSNSDTFRLIVDAPCDSSPCQHGGTCIDETAIYYRCECPPDHEGDNCEIAPVPENPCDSSPCTAQGTCTDLGGGTYDCACPAGHVFYNNICQPDGVESVACESIDDDCENGATCTITRNNVTLEVVATSCNCVLGYTGNKCETDIDDCNPSMCMNGGTCTDEQAGYMCTCAPGFMSLNCMTNIDDCVGHQCLNNATCVDGVEGYTCKCTVHFEGTFCADPMQECESSNPCQNGATCMYSPSLATEVCTCIRGYAGTTCSEIRILECGDYENHCQNGGTCQYNVEQDDPVECVCTEGYTGHKCQDSEDHGLNIVLIVIPILVIILIIFVGIIIFFLCKRRKDNKRQSKLDKGTEEEFQELHLEPGFK